MPQGHQRTKNANSITETLVESKVEHQYSGKITFCDTWGYGRNLKEKDNQIWLNEMQNLSATKKNTNY